MSSDDPDITVNIDTRESEQMPPGLVKLSQAVEMINEETNLTVESVYYDSESLGTGRFEMSGEVIL